MKLNIFGKLYLAVLLATSVVIIFMVVVMNWSFRQGFADFQRDIEQERMACLAEYLVEQYSERPNLAFFGRNPIGWASDMSVGLKCPVGGYNLPELSKLGRNNLGRRIRLVDPEGKWISGAQPSDLPFDQIPIAAKKRRLGTLELVATDNSENAGELADSFMQQQVVNLYLVALFAALLSLLITLVVVRQLLTPVKKLTEGAKSLSQGQFSTHIAVASNDELGELARRFNQLADFLQRNEELRAQWIADVSHELRTPLAILRSEIEAMLDGIREPNLERIRSLHTETLSLGQLVDDLYQLSLSDAGDIELPDEVVELNSLLHDLLSVFETRLHEKQIKLVNLLDGEASYPVRGDDKRLYQLFSNLLENSNRYTHNGGSVQVSARTASGQVIIEIADSTPGVPDAALVRLFDRLFRVDESRSRALGGSGLGLSICRNIVTMHQGSIIADHSVLGGLLIRIYLPLVAEKTVINSH